MTLEERIRGRKIGILGMARSGMAAAHLALEMGGEPFVSDNAPADKLTDQCRQLKREGIPFETDGHTKCLLGCDYLIVSPGVPSDIDVLQSAKQRGIPTFSELEFAYWVCPARIVAITGSNGKTTTTTLVGEMMHAAGFDTHVCGNIGQPLAGLVRKMTADSVAVVEVSSFQLEGVEDFKPQVAAILNLTPDHIDRHGNFENYKKAKYRITENQTEHELLVLNRDDRETRVDSPRSDATVGYFTVGASGAAGDYATWVADGWLQTRIAGATERVIAVSDIGIPGPHNLQNAAAAVTVARHMGVDIATIAGVLKSFAGVEHRLEPAGMVAGVTFVNDSKATNVDSVCYALKSIATPIYLICGGRDKGGSYEPIIEAGQNRIEGIVAIGEAREKIINALGRSFPTQMADSLEEAVGKCFEMAHPGETVLLSPGCASFDMFENYEHRGRAFKDAVATLKNGKNRSAKITR